MEESQDISQEKKIEFPPDLDLKSVDYITYLLPKWKTKVISYEEKTSTITFLLSAKTPDEIKAWLKEFQQKNLATYHIRSTEKCSGVLLLFKQRLKCMHNTGCKRVYDPCKKNNTKNTNCPSRIIIDLYPIKKQPYSYRGKDPIRAQNELTSKMPCKIVLVASHNHPLDANDLLRFRPVGEDVKNKLLELYKRGHTPGSALEKIKKDIRLNFPDDYERRLADRRFCPDYSYCHYLHKKEFELKYETVDFDLKGKKILQDILKTFNTNNSDENCTKIHFIDDSNYIICLCPPIFKRTHYYIEAASEVVFLDSSKFLDNDASRLYILLTYSESGGLPLGIIITSSQKADMLTKGLLLLKQMIGDKIFKGNPDGPLVFLTDDVSDERTAIKNVFPASKCLLSAYNVLKAIWKFLSDSDNSIPNDKQFDLYQQFKEMIISKTTSEFIETYNKLILSASDFENVVEFVSDYFERKEEWAFCYRNDLQIFENILETEMVLVKRKIFDRIQPFNVTQMVNFLLTKFVLYHERRLVDAAHNRLKRNYLSRVMRAPPENFLERVEILSSGVSLVPSETKENSYYIVHNDILLCSCFRGNSNLYCKHLDWLCYLFFSKEYIKKITNKEIRKIFFIVATGKELPEKNQNVSEHFDVDINNDVDNTEIDINDNDENSNDSKPIIIYIDEETDDNSLSVAIQQGKEDVEEIKVILTQALEASPHKIAASLQVMKSNLLKLELISEIVSVLAK